MIRWRLNPSRIIIKIPLLCFIKAAIGSNLGDLVLEDLVLQGRSGRSMREIKLRSFQDILLLFLSLLISLIFY